MPKSALCSGTCGQVILTGKGSLPNPMCRSCRKIRRETVGIPIPKKRLCIDCGTATTSKRRNFEKHPAICMNCLIKRAKTTPQHQRERAANNCAIRRARRKSRTVEHIDRREIFNRDNYTCHICNEATDATVRHPSPMAPTIDHVIPLAKGGTHTKDNIKTAHSRCNTSKGARLLSVAS